MVMLENVPRPRSKDDLLTDVAPDSEALTEMIDYPSKLNALAPLSMRSLSVSLGRGQSVERRT